MFDGFDFSHIHSYLNNLGLLIISALVNGCAAVNTIAPLPLIIRSYCSHNGSNGITESHLQAVVPYGKSASIISTDPSGISFMTSRQSPCMISLIIVMLSPLFRLFRRGQYRHTLRLIRLFPIPEIDTKKFL